MTSQRILVMGDNHGDAESIQRVVRETEDERFDFIIHVGDLTNAKYSDDPEAGTKHLEAISPHLETLAERGTLIYIWGNRDGYGDSVRGELLSAGTLLHEETKTINGQRFTTELDDVEDDTILLTHGLHPQLVDHFDGRAYFSGHEHIGRYKGRCLNSAFLYRDDLHGSDPLIGGYFVVTITDDPPFEVEFRNLDALKRIICHDHIDRGVLFQPHYHSCQFCHYDGKLEQEMLTTAYYGLTHASDREAVSDEELVDYAVSLFEHPPEGFATSFATYLEEVDMKPLTPFTRNNAEKITKGY